MSGEDALWAQTFVWTANTIGLIYNIPQIIHTYKRKKADDISSSFLVLRFITSIMWTFYCIYFQMWDVGVSWLISLITTLLIMYYKFNIQLIDFTNNSVINVVYNQNDSIDMSQDVYTLSHDSYIIPDIIIESDNKTDIESDNETDNEIEKDT